MNDFMTCFGAVLLGAFLVGGAWFVWRTWQQGTEEAEEYDRAERRELGQCPGCGYDLRGTRHERCPECGEPADGAEPAMSAWAEASELDVHALRDEWPAEDAAVRVPAASETPVVVYTTRDGWASDLLAEQLEARGVQAGVDRRDSQELIGAVVHPVSQYAVVVWSEDKSLARGIIDQFRKPTRV
jgi:hypothetical protein